MRMRQIRIFILYRKTENSKSGRRAYLYFSEKEYLDAFYVLKALHPNDRFDLYTRWVKVDSSYDLCLKN